MEPIQMVDLKRQYQKIKKDVDEAVLKVMESSAFINGQPVRDFAGQLADYLGVKHVIPCANGTDALQISMMALGLQPGDEVITPSFTYIATVEVIALLKLKPVFVDVDPKTFCLDVQQVEKAITNKTKAIVPVHLYGQSVDMEPLMQLAEAHHLAVIEDNAQAIGSSYTFGNGTTKKTGAIGDLGCTSFFPSKNLGCYGDGGAISTDNEELAAKVKMIANHGQSKQYHHDIVGCNSRLDTIQAAVLGVKLPLLDEYIDARRALADKYDKALGQFGGIAVPYRAPYSQHVFHQYTLQLEGVSRDDMKAYLAEKHIPAMIYYPLPAHRQKMFASFGVADIKLPVTDWLSERVISLPMHTEMQDEQFDYITSNISKFLNK